MFGNALQGLKSIDPYEDPRLRNPDPLGLGVQQRAMDEHWNDIFTSRRQRFGPLPNPQWMGYFQSVKEAGRGKPVRFGYSQQPQQDVSRSVGRMQQIDQAMPMQYGGDSPSQQLGTPLDGLKRYR